MNRIFVLLSFLGLITLSQAACADWTSDYIVGENYSGLLDIGTLGARKHVVLPPSEGNWNLVSVNDYWTQRSVNMGRLVFAEVIDDKVVAVLEATASHSSTGNIWPDMCRASEKHLFRDNFPGTSYPLEKCLIIEAVKPSALPDMANDSGFNYSLNPQSKLIQAIATIQGNQYLQVKITSISSAESGKSNFEKAYVEWAKKYSEVLETALTHTADSSSRKVVGIPRQLADGSVAESAKGNGKRGDLSHEQILRSIEKLKEFKDKGIITEDEFRTKKDELLKRL